MNLIDHSCLDDFSVYLFYIDGTMILGRVVVENGEYFIEEPIALMPNPQTGNIQPILFPFMRDVVMKDPSAIFLSIHAAGGFAEAKDEFVELYERVCEEVRASRSGIQVVQKPKIVLA